MWHGIIGHDEVVEQFRRILAARRLASTYLFVGPEGVGKRQVARKLAHSLLCTESDEVALDPCGQCESCRMFVTRNHPDLVEIELPRDKSTLPIEIFIGDQDHRNQEGLCYQLGLRPFFGRRKIAIIDDADHFSIASANCLLKTLEEPPPNALLILIGTSPNRQLPTIRSRSQIVRFAGLDQETITRLLISTGVTADHQLASQAARWSEGSIGRAHQLANPALWGFRDQLFAALTEAPLDSVRLAQAVQVFVDEAGKEPLEKRNRLRTVIGFAIEYFREKLRTEKAADSDLDSLDACLTGLEQIDRNANLGLIVQYWCEQLSGLCVKIS